MADETHVQVRFTVHDDETGADFTDALYFPLADWPVADDVLTAQKQARFLIWKQAITQPAHEPEPVRASDLAQQASALAQQATALAQQAVEASSDGQ